MLYIEALVLNLHMCVDSLACVDIHYYYSLLLTNFVLHELKFFCCKNPFLYTCANSLRARLPNPPAQIPKRERENQIEGRFKQYVWNSWSDKGKLSGSNIAAALNNSTSGKRLRKFSTICFTKATSSFSICFLTLTPPWFPKFTVNVPFPTSLRLFESKGPQRIGSETTKFLLVNAFTCFINLFESSIWMVSLNLKGFVKLSQDR